MCKERFIKIDGKEEPVSQNVYLAFKRPAWNERKRRKTRSEKERSLEAFMDDGYDIPSQQALVDEIVEDKLLFEMLYSSLAELTDDERSLIDSIYYENQSIRDYAKAKETNHTKIVRQHKSVLEKLRRLLKIN